MALGITRHQLLVDPRIPYTSHNSAACLLLDARDDAHDLAARAARHLERSAAPGSDPGLCLAGAHAVPDEVIAFGERAKREIVAADEARRLADRAGITLSAHGGTGLGVIGALAAVGLRASGNDGRFIELGATRSLAGRVSVADLRAAGIRAFAVGERVVEPPLDATIEVGDWCRPVLRGGMPTLLLEETTTDGPDRWRAVPRDHIRSR